MAVDASGPVAMICCKPNLFSSDVFVVTQIHCKQDLGAKAKVPTTEFLLKNIEAHIRAVHNRPEALLGLVDARQKGMQEGYLKAGYKVCGTMAIRTGDMRIWYRKEL